jgi:hypothetical protein
LVARGYRSKSRNCHHEPQNCCVYGIHWDGTADDSAGADSINTLFGVMRDIVPYHGDVESASFSAGESGGDDVLLRFPESPGSMQKGHAKPGTQAS